MRPHDQLRHHYRVAQGLVVVTAPVSCPEGEVITPCAAPLGGVADIGVGLAADEDPNAGLPPGSELDELVP